MIGNLGFFEILLILLIALVVFGPNRLPEIGRAIGRSMADFRKSLREVSITLMCLR